MTDLTVNKEILVGLGNELNRIGTALLATNTREPFRCGVDDLPGTATAAVSAAAIDQVKTALTSVATRINAMGAAAIRCAANYEEADKAFADLLNTTTGGVYS
ncbi:hypothetical protein ACFWU5_01920 [Nocardia sp. NPDC058640]|uniref:hypothetical protein n=1 Tax=Nocardia sp. NPDC058640 TaxID=3346571 RepID=UPI00364F510E